MSPRTVIKAPLTTLTLDSSNLVPNPTLMASSFSTITGTVDKPMKLQVGKDVTILEMSETGLYTPAVTGMEKHVVLVVAQ